MGAALDLFTALVPIIAISQLTNYQNSNGNPSSWLSNFGGFQDDLRYGSGIKGSDLNLHAAIAAISVLVAALVQILNAVAVCFSPSWYEGNANDGTNCSISGGKGFKLVFGFLVIVLSIPGLIDFGQLRLVQPYKGIDAPAQVTFIVTILSALFFGIDKVIGSTTESLTDKKPVIAFLA